MEETIAIGRRKTAVASVRLRGGKGNIDVNGKSFEQYFPIEFQRATVLAPFEKLGGNSRYDFLVRVKGGGPEAQAVAVRLGLARALVENDENLRHEFKSQGFLTRDSRKKERKKYGLAGARKRRQFSKR